MKRTYLILTVVFTAILIGFPTSRSGTRVESYVENETVTKSDIIKTFDCNRTLIAHESLQMNMTMLGPIHSETRGYIQSTENISIEILLLPDKETFYNWTSNFHNITYYFSTSSVETAKLVITIENINSLQVTTNGVLKGYSIYNAQVPVTKYRTVEYVQWLPWWMPSP